jgi:C_GCAxxG_C_C family probable redox protein
MDNNKVEKAIELHKAGYNCGQSVFCAFADMFNIDNDIALKMTQPLGSGLGELRELCGAVNAMALVIGLQEGSSNPADKETKKKCYEKTKELSLEFQEKNGSIICKQLLGLDKNFVPKIKKKPCVEYVKDCAILLEEYLNASQK